MSMTFLYWSIPVILLLHELEEWNILKWYKLNYLNPPSSDNWVLSNLGTFLLGVF